VALIVAIAVVLGGIAYFFFLRRPIQALFFRPANPPPPSKNGSNGTIPGVDAGQQTVGYGDPGTVPDAPT
jgi:hypothetical protein